MSSHQNEFSRLVEIKKLNTTPKEYKLIPTDEENSKLAFRFGFALISDIMSIVSLTKKGSRVFIEGILSGKIQKDEFSPLTSIEEKIQVLLFTDKTAKDFDPSRLEDDIQDTWDCELLEEETETLDIGEILAQYISLAVFNLEINQQHEDKIIKLF